MKHVISGVKEFQQNVYPEKKDIFQKLAKGQSPEVLFVTCADSRIDPAMITQTDPGDLFVCRNAGNVVPPHGAQDGGMIGSIEFGVAALGVSHIVVCGHSDCGAMKGAINPAALDALPNVKEWLCHCRGANEAVKARHGKDSLSLDNLDEITQENVVQQLQHLRTHPAVAAKIAAGEIQLHGWVYDIESGDIQCYSDNSGTFLPLEEAYA